MRGRFVGSSVCVSLTHFQSPTEPAPQPGSSAGPATDPGAAPQPGPSAGSAASSTVPSDAAGLVGYRGLSARGWRHGHTDDCDYTHAPQPGSSAGPATDPGAAPQPGPSAGSAASSTVPSDAAGLVGYRGLSARGWRHGHTDDCDYTHGSSMRRSIHPSDTGYLSEALDPNSNQTWGNSQRWLPVKTGSRPASANRSTQVATRENMLTVNTAETTHSCTNHPIDGSTDWSVKTTTTKPGTSAYTQVICGAHTHVIGDERDGAVNRHPKSHSLAEIPHVPEYGLSSRDYQQAAGGDTVSAAGDTGLSSQSWEPGPQPPRSRTRSAHRGSASPLAGPATDPGAAPQPGPSAGPATDPGAAPQPGTSARSATSSTVVSDAACLVGYTGLSARGWRHGHTDDCDYTHGRSTSATASSRHTGRHIRPVSANLATEQSQRYVMERLQAMYRARRASSAKPRCVSYMWQPQTNSPVLQQTVQQTSPTPPAYTCSSHLKPLDKFRGIVRLAIYLQRFMAAIVDNCSDRTMRSASELQWMTVYAEKHDVTLAFNKHLYSRDRVSAHVPDWAVSILHKSPEKRTHQDCRLLHALLRGMKNFDLFTSEVQMALCKAFTLERVTEGRVVLKSGHVGRNFYLIYCGSVFVNLEDSTRDGRKFMRTIAVLTRGQSFGELALLQDIRRTATVSVRERVELLTVDKAVFASVCPRIFERELAEKYSFLGSLDLFSAKYWSSESIRALTMYAQIQEFQTNKVIVSNSLTEEWIYVCMQGRCQVLLCLPLDQPLNERPVTRKSSDVILSEEILQLLASTGRQGHEQLQHDDDMREQLLFSLGLDYVHTGKHHRPQLTGGPKLNGGPRLAGDQTKAAHSAQETLTLSTFVRRYLQDTVRDVVLLTLGVLEPGDIFDLPSLLNDHSTETRSSPLMLVSSGAKMIRVRKAAFFDWASQRALDNTRTLASKHRNPSNESIRQSYKTSVSWEKFKSILVSDILTHKQLRTQPIYRASASLLRRSVSTTGDFHGGVSSLKNSKILSALHTSPRYESKVMISSSSSSFGECPHPETPDVGDPVNQSSRSTIDTGQHVYLETMKSVGLGETLTIRRHPRCSRRHVPVVRKQKFSLAATLSSRRRPMSAV